MKHYAGKVKYTVEGWVERNMDKIPQSFNDTLQSSTHKAREIRTRSPGVITFGFGHRHVWCASKHCSRQCAFFCVSLVLAVHWMLTYAYREKSALIV